MSIIYLERPAVCAKSLHGSRFHKFAQKARQKTLDGNRQALHFHTGLLKINIFKLIFWEKGGHKKEYSVSSSSLGSHCVPWLGEGLSIPSPNYPVLWFPLPCGVTLGQYLSRSSLHRLAGLPCRLFLSYRLQVVTREVLRSSLRRLICPAQDHFIFLSVDYIYDFCPLPDPDVGLSIFICDVEHTSFHFGLCGRKFVLCLFGQCPGLCTICHSWQHTGVVHLSLQADGKVAFEDVPVFGVCRPACHDFSLYLFVLVIFLEAVVLSQVHVAFNIFYQHIVHVYWGVVYNHHLCLCDVYAFDNVDKYGRRLIAHVIVMNRRRG